MPVSTPNYLSIDPNGVVGALFPGGVAITAGDYPQGISPKTTKAVSWHKDTPTGALVASIGGTVSADGFTTELREGATAPDPNPVNFNTLTMLRHVAKGGDAGNTQVRVGAGTNGIVGDRKLIDGNGASDFLQWNTGTPGLYGPYFCQAIGLGAGAQQAFNVTLPSIPKGSSTDLFMFGACDPEGWGIARYHTPTPAGGPFTNIVIDLLNPTSGAQNIGWLFGLINF